MRRRTALILLSAYLLFCSVSLIALALYSFTLPVRQPWGGIFGLVLAIAPLLLVRLALRQARGLRGSALLFRSLRIPGQNGRFFRGANATIDTPCGPRSTTTGPVALRHLLDDFAIVAEQAGAPVGSSRRPGLATEAIRRALVDEGLGAPDELLALYEWADGLELSDSAAAGLQIMPTMGYSSLASAVARRRAGGGPDGWLSLTDGEQSPLVSCDAAADGPPRLAGSRSAIGRPGAVSVCTLVGWNTELILTGAAVWTEDGWTIDAGRKPRAMTEAGF